MEAGKPCVKTPLQLELLEQFYAKERYPTQSEMKNYAASLRLTLKQVRGWFVERRRKEKREKGGSELTSAYYAEKFRSICRSRETGKLSYPAIATINKPFRVQDRLWTPDYIISKILRKDGPALGADFDSIPDRSSSESPASRFAGQEAQGSPKRRKVCKRQDCNGKEVPGKKHGVGKGLITAWRVANPGAGCYPTGIGCDLVPSIASSQKLSVKRKQLKRPRPLRKDNCLGNKKQEKKARVPLQRRKQVVHKLTGRKECGLAVEEIASREQHDLFGDLIDDEELELKELQAGPNPVTCSAHFATSTLHRCSFCKDLLSKFPPVSLKMKQPFCIQPWHSSPEMVKQLFKVVHFLYTYAAVFDIRPFTVDDFAQAFHDKDSLLLVEVHLSLLKFLLSDIKRELSNGFPLQYSTSCKFLRLLQAVRHQDSVVDAWSRFLNPLTWTEILRQIFVAAGYGSKHSISSKELQSKREVNPMVKYGLAPGTLKGELFGILSHQGNKGLKVSELARSTQIGALELNCTMDALELLISSALSSDITLFEKISPSAYRLRISFTEENFQPDIEYSGTINDCSMNTVMDSSSDSEHDSGNSSLSQVDRQSWRRKQKASRLSVDNEIDESHPGEVWLLGLAESEYSNLRIEEKLNALVALVDLLRSISCFRYEKEKECGRDTFPRRLHYGSGAKIKRSTVKQNLTRPSWASLDQMHTRGDHPVDSSTSASKFLLNEGSSSKKNGPVEAGDGFNSHPMQSVFLGSDRRYNQYWLFLGPCSDSDPGHRRIYFESSEDGHWEVIDSEEAFGVLRSVLDNRGTREAFLCASLQKRERCLLQGMSSGNGISSGCRDGEACDQNLISQDSCSPVSDVDNTLSCCDSRNTPLALSGAINLQKGDYQKQNWYKLQAFDKWTWNSFYTTLNAVKYYRRSYLGSLARCEACHDLYWRDEKHCKVCHTTFELHFDLEEKYAIHVATCKAMGENDCSPTHKVLSSQLQSLKAAVYAVESAMPEDSLTGSWRQSAHNLWSKRLRRTSSLAELLQVLTDFVGAINEDWVSACSAAADSSSICEEVIKSFPPFPQTSAAVALWLVKLDALIAPFL
uniref:Homeobox-DDT domain protein RLT3 n=1 Tax=Kalanchoe fedtschenkoi TaxID=63787 RepID=A0A7N0UBZ7_KALFE